MQTYIDIISYLRRKEIIPILRIQTTVLKEIQNFMISRGFIELMPVITSKMTDPLAPDPASTIKKFPVIDYNGQKLVLTQSMILHKQISLISGLDKIFIMSPNIRLEDTKNRLTGRHLFEFTQMDFEIAYANMDQVMSLIEDLLIHVFRRVLDLHKEELGFLGRELKIPSKPFKRYTSHEMIEEFGDRWEMLASQTFKEPFWVTCHKREFYDREDPNKPGHYRNYDLIYPEGFGEALSGGEREWEYEIIYKKMIEGGIDPSKFEEYLLLAKKGLLKPSAGAGLGVERFIRYITGVKHIGEIQLFRRVPGEKIIF